MISKTEAQDWVAQAMEIANEGNWSELIASGIDNDGLEMLRQLRNFHRDIERLEEAESKMHQALVNRVMVSMVWDDSDEPEPAGANASGANGSAPVQGSKPAAAGYSGPRTPNASDTSRSALLVEPEPRTPKADPMADLFIQRRAS